MRVLTGLVVVLMVLVPSGAVSMPVPSATEPGPHYPSRAGGAPDEGEAPMGMGTPTLAIVAGVFLVATTAMGVARLADDDDSNDAAGYWLLLPGVSMGIAALVSWIGDREFREEQEH